MRRIFSLEFLIVVLVALGITVAIFRQVFFDHKTLFPSNLLVSSYAPWKYEPVPEYPNGPPNKPIGFDDIRQAYPDRELLRDSLLKGVVPLWNPYIYSGVPFMASLQGAVWYPLSWIAATLSPIQGWNFLVVIQPIASVIFMYLFLRSLKFRIPFAAFGSLVYAFSAWMVVYWQEVLVVEHSFMWMPLALYASNRVWKNFHDSLGVFLLLFSLICCVFGGFLQMSVYVYGVVIIWNIFLFFTLRREPHHAKSAWVIVFAIVCSILIEGIQLIPSLQAFLLSPRGTNDGSFVFRDDLLPIQHLLTLLAPDFWGNPATYNYFASTGFYFEKIIFMGIVPLVFTLYGMFQAKKKAIIFWMGLGLICFSMAFALPTSWLPYYLHIPILSTSYPTRILGVSVFAFSILSCYGLEEFLHKPNWKLIVLILLGLTVVLGIGWCVVLSSWCINVNYHTHVLWCAGKTSMVWGFFENILSLKKNASLYATISLRNLIVPTVFLLSGWGVVLLAKFSKKLVFIVVVLLTVLSSYYFIEKYVYVGEQRFVYPELPVITKLTELSGYNRVWGYGNAFIEKNIPEYLHWYSTDGYSNLSSSRYAQLMSTIDNNGMLGGVIRRSDTDLSDLAETDSFATNSSRLRLMSLLGVKYVLEAKKGTLQDSLPTDKRFPANIFTLAWENSAWRIWQYLPALPRAVFATTYSVKTKPEDIIAALYDKNTNLSNTVILEKNPEISFAQSHIPGQARIVSYALDSVTIRTTSSSDGFLLLTDNYYPGWKVTVDGKPMELYRADYSFRAVYVSRGNHVVLFQYAPSIVIIGGIVTMVGIISGIAFIIILRKKRSMQ